MRLASSFDRPIAPTAIGVAYRVAALDTGCADVSVLVHERSQRRRLAHTQRPTSLFGLASLAMSYRMTARSPTRGQVVRFDHNEITREETVMDTNVKIALAIIAGAALGAAGIQTLHAQAKPKAYSITEQETLDDAAAKAYSPLVQAAQKAAGGARNFRTTGGRIVSIEGAPAPKRVAITEWDSLEQAQAFYTSKAFKDLAPQRDKAMKVTRRYIVEAQP